MISKQMIELAGKNSAIRAMFEEGNRLASIYGRENVYDFSLGNPNFPAPTAVKETAVRLLQEEDPVALHGYMPNAGFPTVRRSVANSLNRRFGTEFTEGNILMTVGAAGGLNVILRTLLNPGDEVLAFAPYFVEYGNYVSNYGGVLRVVPADTQSFLPNVEEMTRMINPKTKAIIVNNPNNPTGTVYGEDVIRCLSTALEAKQKEYGTSIYLISDEPYRELVYDSLAVPWLTKYYRNTVVGYSWSKSLSLPGERIGYLCIPSEIDESELIWNAACIANRVLGFVNAPSLFQLVAAECVDEKTSVEPYDANRKALYGALTGMGFECVLPQGAFYLWMKTPESDIDFVNAAKAERILVVPGSSFACPGYVRIAYCVSPETIVQAIPAFRKLAEHYHLIASE